MLVELSSDVLERFEAEASKRGVSYASLLERGLDAFAIVNAEPHEDISLSAAPTGGVLEIMMENPLHQRLSRVLRASGWDVSSLVGTVLRALEATEERSQARLSLGTHRIVRVEADLEVLDYWERVPCRIPRTMSDILGLAVKDFDEKMEYDAPSIEGHDTGFLDVELPVGHIDWLKRQSRDRGLPVFSDPHDGAPSVFHRGLVFASGRIRSGRSPGVRSSPMPTRALRRTACGREWIGGIRLPGRARCR